MVRNGLCLTVTFLGWLLVRYGLMWWFCNSDYQGYVLFFAMAMVWPDIYVCKYLATWSQAIQDQAGGLGRKGALANKFILAAFGWSVLASPFCASVVLIHSESATGNQAAHRGVVSFEDVGTLPEESCFEVSGAAPFVWYLGAVEYSITRRSEKFYYAAPLESAEWDPSREVRLWAIVDERELSQGVLTRNRIACHIPTKNPHYSAFQTAVANAESRFDLKSAPSAMLVRLLASPEAAAPAYGGQDVWIGVLYGFSVIPTLLYPALLWVAPKKREPMFASREVDAAELENPSVAMVPSMWNSQSRLLIAKRRFWFGWQVLGFVVLAAVMIGWLADIWALLLVIVVPALELWLLLRAFPDSETRGSLRMAATWLLPVGMMLALVLVNVSKFSLEEAKGYDSQVKWSELGPNTQHGTIVALPEEVSIRQEWTGEYWAPNHETSAWRAFPLVEPTWGPSQPIKYWFMSTDRLDSRFHHERPKFVRVAREQDSFQMRHAITDAEYHHEIVAADGAIILEPVVDPKKQSQEAFGFVVLGFLGCGLSWAVCALYWPIARPRSG